MTSIFLRRARPRISRLNTRVRSALLCVSCVSLLPQTWPAVLESGHLSSFRGFVRSVWLVNGVVASSGAWFVFSLAVGRLS